MGTNISKQTAPHLWYPEILHWKEGDEILARNASAKNWFTKFLAFENGNLNLCYYYKGITSSGMIIVEEKESGVMHKLNFRTFVKRARNLSLSNRALDLELNDSKEYMMLIQEFQKAYIELEESDQNKLLG